jgi:hypothetical protein
MDGDDVKPIPPGLSFREALKAGYAAVRSEPYMALVRQLPCAVCDAPGPSDPHHPHGVGYRGSGTKAPDIWCIPLCHPHHMELHADRVAWEEKYGEQFEFVVVTVAHLWVKGLITLGKA